MKSRKKTVRYAKGTKKDQADADIIELEFSSILIETDHTKTFDNHIHLLLRLTPSSRNLLDYIVMVMTRDNDILNSSLFKDQFRKTQKQAGQKTISDSSINNCFSELKDCYILLKDSQKKRGTYIVNPVYYWKGTQQTRAKKVRQIKEDPFYIENKITRQTILKQNRTKKRKMKKG